MTKRNDAAVECVVADDPAIPTLLDQPVTRNDLRAHRGKRDEHLRDLRFQLFLVAVRADQAVGGTDSHASQIEVRRFRQIDLVCCHLRARTRNHRQAIT